MDKKEGFFEQIISQHPEFVGEYVPFVVGDVFVSNNENNIKGGYKKEKISDELFEAAFRGVMQKETPTLNYNNGVYCYAGWGKSGKPEIYLFCEQDIADLFYNAGLKVSSNYFVPMSNGEDYELGTISRLNSITNDRHKDDINFKFNKNKIGIFKKVIQKNPEFATRYTSIKVNDKYLLDNKTEEVSFVDIDSAIKSLKEKGEPTISYNNGVHCFSGIELDPVSKKPVVTVYLFPDSELSEILVKEGVIDIHGNGYVPMSNGEFLVTKNGTTIDFGDTKIHNRADSLRKSKNIINNNIMFREGAKNERF